MIDPLRARKHKVSIDVPPGYDPDDTSNAPGNRAVVKTEEGITVTIRKFDPSQPRDESGKWTDGGGGGGPIDYQARVGHVLDVLKEYGTSGATDVFASGMLTNEAQQYQNKLIADQHAKADANGVPKDRQAILIGGMPGAGKTFILDNKLGDAGLKRGDYATVEYDALRSQYAADGRVPKVEDLSPMEASPLINGELQDATRNLWDSYVSEGRNVIFDGTMASQDQVQGQINDLRGAGYTIRGLFVDIPPSESEAGSLSRYTKGEQPYREQGVGLGGRVNDPAVYAQSAAAGGAYGSQERQTFETVKPQFDEYWTFNNSNRAGKLIEHGVKP